MSTQTQTKVRLHEFCRAIAIRIGESETLYLEPELAEQLAAELKIASVQIKNGYHYETKEIGA